MQVFIGQRAQRLKTEIIELRATGENHVDAAPDSTMTEGLSEMTLSDSDLANDEHRCMLGQIPVRGQIMN
jgi:hypothetical protein